MCVLAETSFVFTKGNWMYKASRGIQVSGCILGSRNDLIGQVGTSIRASGVTNLLNTTIRNGYFEFKDFGVRIDGLGSAPYTRINYNHFKKLESEEATGNAIQITSPFGVDPTTSLNDAHIIGNQINIHGPATGIYINSQNGWGIYNNSVHFWDFTDNTGQTLYPEINLSNSDYNYLNGNQMSSSNSTNQFTGALQLNHSEWNTLCCNATYETTIGISFSGECDNTKLYHTDIGSHSSGLICNGGTITGGQIVDEFGNKQHAGNLWNGTYSGGAVSPLWGR